MTSTKRKHLIRSVTMKAKKKKNIKQLNTLMLRLSTAEGKEVTILG